MNLRTSLLLALAALGAAAHANLLVNGDFESTAGATPGGYQILADDGVPGGFYASTGVLEIGDNALYGVSGFAGQIAELDSDGNDSALSQTFTGASTSYLVSFDYALRGNGGTTPASAAFDVLFNGVVVASILPTSTSATTLSVPVSGLMGSNTLTFHETGTLDSYGAIVDNVSVQAVPEPSAFAALGLGGLGLLRRRRKA